MFKRVVENFFTVKTDDLQKSPLTPIDQAEPKAVVRAPPPTLITPESFAGRRLILTTEGHNIHSPSTLPKNKAMSTTKSDSNLTQKRASLTPESPGQSKPRSNSATMARKDDADNANVSDDRKYPYIPPTKSLAADSKVFTVAQVLMQQKKERDGPIRKEDLNDFERWIFNGRTDDLQQAESILFK